MYGLRRQRRRRPALAPRDHPSDGFEHRRIAGGDGRPLHHRGAHGRGVGGLRETAGARGRRSARDDRIRRSGTQPLARLQPRARAAQTSRLEPERGAPARVRGNDASRDRRPDRARVAQRRKPSTAPTSSSSPLPRENRCCAASGSRTARTSLPSVPAGRINARWTRRWWRVHVSSSIRGRGRWRKRGIYCCRYGKARSTRRTLSESWDSWPRARSPGDASPEEVTLFKSLGMAVEDVAAAHLAYERATERGLGRGFPGSRAGPLPVHRRAIAGSCSSSSPRANASSSSRRCASVASADIGRRRRGTRFGRARSNRGRHATAAATPAGARNFAACAFSTASRSFVSAISRSSPPIAHPTNSADLNKHVVGRLPRAVLGPCVSLLISIRPHGPPSPSGSCYHSPMRSGRPLPRMRGTFCCCGTGASAPRRHRRKPRTPCGARASATHLRTLSTTRRSRCCARQSRIAPDQSGHASIARERRSG